jgi:hypothetical protein
MLLRLQAMPGVVEFGDVSDEDDARDMLAKAGRQKQSKQHGTNPNSNSSSSRQDKAGTKQQQQQGAKEPKQKQQLAQHKVGEMAHAEPNVPAEQRQQLFGDAGAAGAGGSSDGSWSGLGLSEVLSDHLVALNFQEPTQVRALDALLQRVHCRYAWCALLSDAGGCAALLARRCIIQQGAHTNYTSCRWLYSGVKLCQHACS